MHAIAHLEHSLLSYTLSTKFNMVVLDPILYLTSVAVSFHNNILYTSLLHACSFYLHVILCFKAVVLVLEVERMVPLVLGKVHTKMQISTTLNCLSHCTFVPKLIIGASLSEPNINGTAVRELYIYIYIIIIMVRRSREIYAQYGSMDLSAKYSIAHSHAWATRRIYAVLI